MCANRDDEPCELCFAGRSNGHRASNVSTVSGTVQVSSTRDVLSNTIGALGVAAPAIKLEPGARRTPAPASAAHRRWGGGLTVRDLLQCKMQVSGSLPLLQ